MAHPRVVILNRQASVAVAEDAEQVDEKVDEVEVEVEGAEGGKAAVGHCRVGHRHALDGLGVPGGDTDEEHHAGDADDPVKGRVGPEDVDHHQNDEAEESHVEVCADFCKVTVCEITVNAHGTEHTGRDQECLEDGRE